MKKPMPNQPLQWTAGERFGCSRTPLARRHFALAALEHTMNLRPSIPSIGLVVLALAMAVPVPGKKMAPPRVSDVAGIYVGYSEGSEFLWLELDPDGTGTVAVSYILDSPVRLYRIQSWRLTDFRIEIQARSMDAQAEPITFRKLRFAWWWVDGEFGGAGWKRTIRLYNERKWQTHIVQIQQRLTRYRQEKQ